MSQFLQTGSKTLDSIGNFSRDTELLTASKVNRELALRQDARAQRQQDLALVSSSAKEHQPILQQLSLSNPKAVDGYIQNLRSSNKALAESMDRLGISDMKAVISTSGSVGMEMPVPMSDEIRQKIKAVSGVDVPEGVTQAIIKSDGRGNVNYSAASASNRPELMKQENVLRKEFISETKDFTKIRDAYNRIQEVSKNPSPAGDIALIFNYMKMLDPTSVVRESEYATAENAGSVPQAIINKYNKALEGERLGETRQDFIKKSEELYDAMNRQLGKTSKTYSDMAVRQGLDPQNVVFDIGIESGSSQKASNIMQDKSGISWEVVYQNGKPVGKRRVSPGGEVNYGSSEIGKTMKQVMNPNG
jgi:hypothetical protein